MADKEPTEASATAKAEKTVPTALVGIASALDASGPNSVDPATEFSTSGAPRQVTEFDVDHPAVDNDPRAGTTAHQNRIDFNDPTISGREAVERALKAQG